jgi:hypothetical protein
MFLRVSICTSFISDRVDDLVQLDSKSAVALLRTTALEKLYGPTSCVPLRIAVLLRDAPIEDQPTSLCQDTKSVCEFRQSPHLVDSRLRC